VHTKSRIFKCAEPGCGRIVTQKSNLKSHAWTHVKGNPRGTTTSGGNIEEKSARRSQQVITSSPTGVKLASRPAPIDARRPFAEGRALGYLSANTPLDTGTQPRQVRARPMDAPEALLSFPNYFIEQALPGASTAFTERPQPCSYTERGSMRIYSPPPFPPPTALSGIRNSSLCTTNNACIPLIPTSSFHSSYQADISSDSCAVQRDPLFSVTPRDEATLRDWSCAVLMPSSEGIIVTDWDRGVASGVVSDPTAFLQSPMINFPNTLLQPNPLLQ